MSPEKKNLTKQLVKEGRLDLISGGWSAPDEATTTYDNLIDNLMIGQQFLQKEFGHHSRISWQIDVFGMSSGYARLARDLGFEALVFTRMDYKQRLYDQ